MTHWSLANGRRIGSFDGHTADVKSTSLSPDGLLLATGSDDNTVRVWKLRSHRLLAEFACGAGAIWSVAFSRDGKTIAAGTFEGPIQLWNIAASQQSATLPGHISYVASLAFSPDGRTLASASMDKTIRQHDTNRIRKDHYEHRDHRSNVRGTLGKRWAKAGPDQVRRA